MENQQFDYPLSKGVNSEVIAKLYAIGKLPSDTTPEADNFQIDLFDELLQSLTLPVSSEDALKLINLSPPVGSGCFGVEWTLLHIIETISVEDIDIILKLAEENEIRELIKARLENYKNSLKK